MARPYGSADGTKRDKRVTVSLTQGEQSKLREYAAIHGLSVTDFVVLKCVYEDQEFVIVDTESVLDILAQLKTELRRQGNNLNQIAAGLNSLRFTQKKIKKEKIDNALTKIEKVKRNNLDLDRWLDKIAKKTVEDSFVRRVL